MKENRVCWLCGKNGSIDPLDKHHLWGGALRNKSEKYGLYVYLCHHECHIFGTRAAHKSGAVMDELHRYGQRKAMLEQGWTAAEFIAEFGKNYLEVHELEDIYRQQRAPDEPMSFRLTEDFIDVLGELGA